MPFNNEGISKHRTSSPTRASQSDASIVVKVADLINMAMGPADKNTVNFKMIQTILHILARNMRLLDQAVELRSSDITPPQLSTKETFKPSRPESKYREKTAETAKVKEKADRDKSKNQEEPERDRNIKETKDTASPLSSSSSMDKIERSKSFEKNNKDEKEQAKLWKIREVYLHNKRKKEREKAIKEGRYTDEERSLDGNEKAKYRKKGIPSSASSSSSSVLSSSITYDSSDDDLNQMLLNSEIERIEKDSKLEQEEKLAKIAKLREVYLRRKERGNEKEKAKVANMNDEQREIYLTEKAGRKRERERERYDKEKAILAKLNDNERKKYFVFKEEKEKAIVNAEDKYRAERAKTRTRSESDIEKESERSETDSETYEIETVQNDILLSLEEQLAKIAKIRNVYLRKKEREMAKLGNLNDEEREQYLKDKSKKSSAKERERHEKEMGISEKLKSEKTELRISEMENYLKQVEKEESEESKLGQKNTERAEREKEKDREESLKEMEKLANMNDEKKDKHFRNDEQRKQSKLDALDRNISHREIDEKEKATKAPMVKDTESEQYLKQNEKAKLDAKIMETFGNRDDEEREKADFNAQERETTEIEIDEKEKGKIAKSNESEMKNNLKQKGKAHRDKAKTDELARERVKGQKKREQDEHKREKEQKNKREEEQVKDRKTEREYEHEKEQDYENEREEKELKQNREEEEEVKELNTREYEHEKEGEKENEQEEKKHIDKEQVNKRDTEQEYEHEKERNKEYEKERDEEYEKELEKQPEKDKEQEKETDKEREKDRDKERQQKRVKDQEKDRENVRESNKIPKKEPEEEQKPEREFEEETERDKERDTKREKERDKERQQERVKDQEKVREEERKKDQERKMKPKQERDKEREKELDKKTKKEREEEQKPEREFEEETERDKERKKQQKNERQKERKEEREMERDEKQETERDGERDIKRERENEREIKREREMEREREREKEKETETHFKERDRSKGKDSRTRVGSIQIVTRSEFELLEAKVNELQEKTAPIPYPSMPDNEKLRTDLARGRASLTDTMEAMQVSARVQATETAMSQMADLLTQLAAAGALPQDVVKQVGEVTAGMGRPASGESPDGVGTTSPRSSLSRSEPARRSVGTPSSRLGVAETLPGDGGSRSTRKNVAYPIGERIRSVAIIEDGQSRHTLGTSMSTVGVDRKKYSGLTTASKAHFMKSCVTHPELDDAQRDLKDALIKKINSMVSNALRLAEIAHMTVRQVSDQMEIATRVASRINELFSLVSDSAEQLSGFGAGVNSQLQNFNEIIFQIRCELNDGIVFFNQTLANKETEAVKELNNRFQDLVIGLDQTRNTLRKFDYFQNAMGDEVTNLFNCVEALREQKADREELLDGIRDKADKVRLEGLIKDLDFEPARKKLDQRLEECYSKFKNQDEVWMQALEDLNAFAVSKASGDELFEFTYTTEIDLNKLKDELQSLATALGEPKAILLTRKISEGGTCGPCQAPALQDPTADCQPPLLPAAMQRHPPIAEEPCTQLVKEPRQLGEREHICKRWTGGSHTLINKSVVHQDSGDIHVYMPPTRKYAGIGNDGKLYQLEEQLLPCPECNKLDIDEEKVQEQGAGEPGVKKVMEFNFKKLK